MRKIAGAKVDAVEGEEEGNGVMVCAAGVMVGVVERDRESITRQRLRVGADTLLHQPYESGPAGDPRARLADAIEDILMRGHGATSTGISGIRLTALTWERKSSAAAVSTPATPSQSVA